MAKKVQIQRQTTSPFDFEFSKEYFPVIMMTFAALAALITNFIPKVFLNAELSLKMHYDVLSGKAMAFYQYQMYVHDNILERLYYLLGQSPYNFAVVHIIYYSVGWLLFLFFLYLLCRKYSTVLASTAVILFLIAISGFFWHDNYYHPGDSWGCLVTVFLIREILDKRRPFVMYPLYLISGFIWEKTLLLPLSVGLSDYLRNKKPAILTIELLIAIFSTSIGQLLPRLIYGTDRPIDGITLAANLHSIPVYLLYMMIVFGLVLYSIIRYWRETPVLYRMIVLQFPIWITIYLVLNGVLTEMRGIYIMIPLLWPAFAEGVDRWLIIHENRN